MLKRRVHLGVLAGLVCGFIGVLPPQAQAQIVVNGVLRTITATQRPIENVEVRNISKDRILQVNISAKESVIDDDRNETILPTEDLLIAPQSMILRPDEHKRARLVLRTPPGEKERYYRVTFQAQVPEPIRLKALELTQQEQVQQESINASVVLVSGVGMFITVSPKNPKSKLTWARDASGITFKNEGNTSVDMRLRKNYCFEGAQKTCITLPDKRIYPGHTWRFEIPGNQSLVYYYNVYKKTKKAVIGAVK